MEELCAAARPRRLFPPPEKSVLNEFVGVRLIAPKFERALQ